MRKNLYMLSLLALPFAALAQPTINNMENYTAPFKMNYQRCDSNVDPSTSGANQHWMFDNLTAKNKVSMWAIAPANSTLSSNFPTANLIIKFESNYNFVNKAADKTTTLGFMDSISTVKRYYDAPIPSSKRPIAFNDNMNASFKQTSTQGGAKTGEGTIDITVDGWGMLHLPGNNYMDVIRVKTTTTAYDTITKTPILVVATIKGISYKWYDDAHKSPLLTWDSTHVDLGGIQPDRISKNVMYLLSEGDPAGVNNVVAQKLNYNGCFKGNSVVVNGDFAAGKEHQVFIMNLNGQEIYKSKFTTTNKTKTFDLNKDLASGMYFITIAETDNFQKHATIQIAK